MAANRERREKTRFRGIDVGEVGREVVWQRIRKRIKLRFSFLESELSDGGDLDLLGSPQRDLFLVAFPGLLTWHFLVLLEKEMDVWEAAAAMVKVNITKLRSTTKR